MADEVQLPRITSGVDPQVVTALQQIAAALTNVAHNTDRTAEAAEAQEGAFGRMGEKVKAVVGDLRGMAETAASVLGAISELSAEQGRLDASSERLGVSFRAAANAAGRYVDQLTIQRAAESAAQTGLRLTQQELDALTRRAAQYAQATGTEMTQAVEQLTEAVVKGEQEGLQRFGGALAEVGRQSGTAGQRLQALVQDANATARATDDASTASARLAGELRSIGREAAGAFTTTLSERIRGLGTDLGTVDGHAETLTEHMRSLGSMAADFALVLGGGLGTVIGGIGTSVNALSNAVIRIGEAYLRLQTLDFRGALSSARAAISETESLRSLTAFTQASMDATLAGARGLAAGGSRPEGAPPPRRASDVMEFSTQDVADAAARDRRPGGGGASRSAAQRQPTIDDLMEGAFRREQALVGPAGLEVPIPANDNAANDLTADRKVEDSIKNMERIRTAATEMADVGRMAFNSFGSAFTNAMLAVATGRASFDEAMRAMLQSTLETIAQQAAVESLKNLAIAAGLQATTYGIPNPGSISAGTAAAIWAAVAVAAGAGAAGMAALAPSGGGAAGGGTTPVPQRPTPSGAGGSAQGGPTIVQHYYNAPVIDGRSSTRAEVGTEMRRDYLDREARRTQGARRAA